MKILIWLGFKVVKDSKVVPELDRLLQWLLSIQKILQLLIIEDKKLRDTKAH